MDNRIFNVNGEGDDMLLRTLELVFEQESDNCTCKGWISSPTHGLILLWHAEEYQKGVHMLPAPMKVKDILPIVVTWLKSDEAKKIKLKDWDRDADHDGSNGPGWRVYCEDWGHVDNNFYAICAITPAFMWYGK